MIPHGNERKVILRTIHSRLLNCVTVCVLPVLLVLLDGLSNAVLLDLLPAIRAQGWRELAPAESPTRRLLIAPLPTVTEFTRCSLLAGLLLSESARRSGRVAAVEILIATPAVRNLIREGKTFQIPSAIQTGHKFGMQTLDDAIMGLLEKKIIDPDDAYTKANDKAKFLPFLKKPPADFTEV